MGYTHYFKELVTDATFSPLVADIVDVAGKHGIRVCGPMGDGEPVINEGNVALNGDGEQGLDHESFVLPSKPLEWFNFCKTARKPYDAVVVATLILAIVNEQPGWESIASDGGWSDWVDPRGGYGEDVIGGVALYEETFGKLNDEEVAKVKAHIGE